MCQKTHDIMAKMRLHSSLYYAVSVRHLLVRFSYQLSKQFVCKWKLNQYPKLVSIIRDPLLIY